MKKNCLSVKFFLLSGAATALTIAAIVVENEVSFNALCVALWCMAAVAAVPAVREFNQVVND